MKDPRDIPHVETGGFSPFLRAARYLDAREAPIHPPSDRL